MWPTQHADDLDAAVRHGVESERRESGANSFTQTQLTYGVSSGRGDRSR
jgi:hypothetical protein